MWHMRISRTSPEPCHLIQVAGLFFSGARASRAGERPAHELRGSLIQLLVLELILDRIPKRACRLRL